MAQTTNKNLYATLTVQSVPTCDIRTTAKSIIGGFDSLVTNTHALANADGRYHWLEITDNRGQENVHLHAVFAMNAAYSGRYYISKSRLNELWYEAIGGSYRSAEVEKIREPLRVTGYISELDKFLGAAELGTRDPQRHLMRVEQMHNLPRYAGAGLLGYGQPDELAAVVYAGDGWKRAECTAAIHAHSQHYEPIPVETVSG